MPSGDAISLIGYCEFFIRRLPDGDRVNCAPARTDPRRLLFPSETVLMGNMEKPMDLSGAERVREALVEGVQEPETAE